jgi:hypothetical protein
MPSITCEINITNKWNQAKFFLFQDTPQPTEGPTGEVFTNIFQVSPKVAAEHDGSSTLSFQMDNTFYALFGTSSGAGSKTRVKTSSYKKIKLGPGGSVVQLSNKNGGIVFNDEAVVGKKCDDKGGFQLLTDDTITDIGNRKRTHKFPFLPCTNDNC